MTRKVRKVSKVSKPVPEPTPESREYHVTPERALFEVMDSFCTELSLALKEQMEAAIAPITGLNKFVERKDKPGVVDLVLSVGPGDFGGGVRLDFELEFDFMYSRRDTWLHKDFDGTTPSTSRFEHDQHNAAGKHVIEAFKIKTRVGYAAAGNQSAQTTLRFAHLLSQVALIGTQLEVFTEGWLSHQQSYIGEALLDKLNEVRADQIERGIIKVEKAEVHEVHSAQT